MTASRICSVEGCENGGYLTRGWCKMHYARWKRHGEPGGARKQHAVSWAGEQCKQEDCSSPAKSLGLCMAHYKRLRRWGDPNIKRPTAPAEDRFWAKVDKREPEECWPWKAGLTAQGYGGFHPSKQETTLAHRYSYEFHKGKIPDGLHIDHLCRNRVCVNPSHLEAVTQLENSSRGLSYRLLNGMDDSCIHGHKYTPDNTYVEPNGYSIRCRRCARERDSKPKRNAAIRRRRYAQEKAA